MKAPELSPKDEADLRDLRAMSADLGGVDRGESEPRCIARAFAECDGCVRITARMRFTMQAWINLENIESPILKGVIPDRVEGVEAALDAFNFTGMEGLEGVELARLAEGMIDIVNYGFGMFCEMRPPESSTAAGNDGMGEWLPLWACLVTQCGLRPADASAMEVCQAYALIAAHRRNQGWSVGGTSYAHRDILEKEALRG